ncbi:MAG: RNA polymerase sigma factor [Flavobacteriaceae bacterium]
MNQHQDEHYINEVIQGNTKSFVILIDRYKHMVFTLAMKMLDNREEAEEVAQDVFVKVYQVLSGFKKDSKFSTWLYKITYNQSLDYLKKRGRNVRTSSIDTDKEYQWSTVENVLDQLQRKERIAIIKDAVNQLAMEDAVIVTLHYFEELSLKEISKVIGRNTNVIKVRLFRSRKRLAQLLLQSLEPEMIEGYGGK